LVVVEADVAGDAGSQLGQVGEAVAVEVLVLEDGPKALGTGVVITTSGGAHGAHDAKTLAEAYHFCIIELTASVRVKPNSA
jgi:hypothetical protein